MEEVNFQIQTISNNGIAEEVIFKFIINYSNHHFFYFLNFILFLNFTILY